MPCIEDWSSNPLAVIQGIIEETGKPTADAVHDFFSNRLHDGSSLARIPSLNDVPLHNLKTNSLVRYRCMVQDMFDPEYFLAQFEVIDHSTKAVSKHCGMYQDVTNMPVSKEINFDSPQNVTVDRQTLYCVPIPGENEWAKLISYKQQTPLSTTNPVEGGTGTKRDRCDGEEVSMETASEPTENTAPQEHSGLPGSEPPKRSRPVQTNDPRNGVEATSTSEPNLNFPLPGEKGPACLVKVYHQRDNFKIADMVEFIGVLSVDPSLAVFSDSKSTDSPAALMEEEMLSEEEQAVHHPPPSLVPRLHCVVARHLAHSNPCIPVELTEVETGEMSQIASAREDVLGVLTQLLYGDVLAAEFLLLHLISSVYRRSGVMAVGKFVLNISGFQSEASTQQLYSVLEQFVPKSHLLSMSLSNMNSIKCCPKKDYKANRVDSGVLQLTDSTHLIIDETALQEGQLNENGIRNIAALKNLLLWQKVEYDFSFYKTDFQTNVVSLVLSEGKSLLPCDCCVAMDRQTDQLVPASTVLQSLAPGCIERIRKYLGLARLSSYSLSPEIQQAVQEDFVTMRQQDRDSMSADDFHLLLQLARLMSMSLCQNTLSTEVWERVKQMELMRRSRLPPGTAASAQ